MTTTQTTTIKETTMSAAEFINQQSLESKSEIENRLWVQLNMRTAELIRAAQSMADLNRQVIEGSQRSLEELTNGEMSRGSSFVSTAERFAEVQNHALQMSERITELLWALDVDEDLRIEIWSVIRKEITTATI